MLTILSAAAMAASLTTATCENLASFYLENATVVSAQAVPEGVFQSPPNTRPNQDTDSIPAHCRLTLELTPTSDSLINAELWLPMDNWNGRFMAMGNGGWAGSIQGFREMQPALRRGYATAGSDNGHSAADGPGGMFALGHPEKIVDFAYRSIHDMTVKSKRLISEAYSQPVDYSYFKGCSTGGRQAMMAAQRYPGDFDGIIAGALANRHIYMHTAGSYRRLQLARNPEMAIPEDTAAMVNQALMAKCDVLKEGFLNDPRQCNFNFATLQCPAGTSNASCLTSPQLAMVEQYYGGLHNSDGELIFSGQALGNPLPTMLSQPESPMGSSDSIRILGFQNADYDMNDFDLDRDMPIIDAATGFIDSVNPDLRAFKAHGGKLFLYAGWGDTAITPVNTVFYYDSVLTEMGQEQDDWMRLFMVPGMGHCRGGDGPHDFDSITVLEQWREQGNAPDQIMASNPESGLSRPLCAHPAASRYDGSGDLADSTNWSCEVTP
jgi:feruloyl esterase